MKIVYTIYKATCLVNNKIYIGFCSTSLDVRVKKHVRQARLNNTSSKLHSAIRKYGAGEFSWEPIYQSLDGQHCLNVMECHFIKEYNSVQDGYNTTHGGGGALGIKQSDYQKQRASEANRGKYMSPETRKLIGDAHRGKHITNEMKSAIAKAQANVRYTLTRPDGTEIQILNLKGFCRENGLCARNMFMVLKGQLKQHKGWTVRKT